MSSKSGRCHLMSFLSGMSGQNGQKGQTMPRWYVGNETVQGYKTWITLSEAVKVDDPTEIVQLTQFWTPGTSWYTVSITDKAGDQDTLIHSTVKWEDAIQKYASLAFGL